LFGSYDRGTTALVGATVEAEPYVFVLGTWARPPAVAPGWRVPVRDVVDAVADAMETYTVRELAPVPIGWRSEVEDMEDTYGEVVVRFETNRTTAWGPACDEFYQAVCDGTLTHDGSETMAQHMAEAVPTDRSGYVIISAPVPPAAGAAVIAHNRAKWRHANPDDEDIVLAVVDPWGDPVPDAVCPSCRFVGEVRLIDGGKAHWCRECGYRWTPKEKA
jgi:hypothetical protein